MKPDGRRGAHTVTTITAARALGFTSTGVIKVLNVVPIHSTLQNGIHGSDLSCLMDEANSITRLFWQRRYVLGGNLESPSNIPILTTYRGGKAVLSRQFREMTRSRIEALLASFPKLADSGTQHTTVEQDSVRYVSSQCKGLELA